MSTLRKRISRVAVALTAAALIAGAAGCAPEPTPTERPSKTTAAPKPEPTATPEPDPAPPAFDRAQHSLDDPTSIWVIVNKLRPLAPQTYVPTDLVQPQVENTNGQPLREEAARAAEAMVAAAAADGVAVHIVSGYRSYDSQVSIYGGFVANQGQAYADTTSARPGFSEHQTGLAADFGGSDGCIIDTCFAQTAAGEWLAAHGAEHGFVMRYPDGLEGITGYHYEPWHFRYVGVPLAQQLKADGVGTLEEFFGLPAAPDYAG